VQAYIWKRPELVWLAPFARASKNAKSIPWVLRDLCLSNYDLIVDGYPRSGNSFLAMALRVVHPELAVRCHCHKPTHIIQALRHKKPTCVIIREPIDAIASAIVHFRWSLAQAIEVYINYYKVLLPYRARLVVAPFHTIISDLPKVFTAINSRFGTSLRPPLFDQAFQERVFNEVRALNWGHDPLWVSLPSSERMPHLSEIKQRLTAQSYAPRLGKAQALYQLFVQQ